MGKKNKKKAVAKDEDWEEPERSAPVSPIPPPPAEATSLVTLDLKLMNWSYMNFKLRVPTSTYLFAIKHKLEERHGRLKDLIICKDAYAEANEMTEDMKTLADYGIVGAPESAPNPAVVPIFYEFKPCDHDDPVLLHLTADA